MNKELIKATRNTYYNAVIKKDPKMLKTHRAAGDRRRNETRAWLAAYKLERGCVDCGYNEFACALQLDHEGVKSISIADARSSIPRLKKEIEDGKCVVRCANCHSVVTWKRKLKEEVIPDAAHDLLARADEPVRFDPLLD